MTESDEDLMLQSIREYKAQQSKPVAVKPSQRVIKLRGQSPSLEKRVNRVQRRARKPTLVFNDVVSAVAYACGITVEQLMAKTNSHPISRPRMIAWRILNVDAAFSGNGLGRRFDKHHTTIMHGVKQVLVVPGMFLLYQQIVETLRADGTIK